MRTKLFALSVMALAFAGCQNTEWKTIQQSLTKVQKK